MSPFDGPPSPTEDECKTCRAPRVDSQRRRCRLRSTGEKRKTFNFSVRHRDKGSDPVVTPKCTYSLSYAGGVGRVQREESRSQGRETAVGWGRTGVTVSRASGSSSSTKGTNGRTGGTVGPGGTRKNNNLLTSHWSRRALPPPPPVHPPRTPDPRTTPGT